MFGAWSKPKDRIHPCPICMKKFTQEGLAEHYGPCLARKTQQDNWNKFQQQQQQEERQALEDLDAEEDRRLKEQVAIHYNQLLVNDMIKWKTKHPRQRYKDDEAWLHAYLRYKFPENMPPRTKEIDPRLLMEHTATFFETRADSPLHNLGAPPGVPVDPEAERRLAAKARARKTRRQSLTSWAKTVKNTKKETDEQNALRASLAETQEYETALEQRGLPTETEGMMGEQRRNALKQRLDDYEASGVSKQWDRRQYTDRHRTFGSGLQPQAGSALDNLVRAGKFKEYDPTGRGTPPQSTKGSISPSISGKTPTPRPHIQGALRDQLTLQSKLPSVGIGDRRKMESLKLQIDDIKSREPKGA